MLYNKPKLRYHRAMNIAVLCQSPFDDAFILTIQLCKLYELLNIGCLLLNDTLGKI